MASLSRILEASQRITCTSDCIAFAILVNQHACDQLNANGIETDEMKRSLRMANLGLQRYQSEFEHNGGE